jgi:DNA-binding SARP family transcriptional activator
MLEFDAQESAQRLGVLKEQAALHPLSEEHHRALIEYLAAAGDRAGALAVYEQLRERLRSDLRVKPSAETQALIERLGRPG